ncbi:hypothetical protein AVEN_145648-1 [Araneus ventricosus]|uniref:Uncharacterized protein n=1 Tax=Araneus ventricosus TaxID=182803 RepID=A0A4Y2P0B1_ARAVE|nr:hypothetical protein AVEN_145648-1 [Araneus ventricosus]
MIGFVPKYSGKHVAQVTGTIDLEQISNAKDTNSQVITVTALSDLATQTVSNSLITTVTALTVNSAQFTGCPARTVDNSEVVPVDQHTVIQAPFLYSLPDRPSHGISSTF